MNLLFFDVDGTLIDSERGQRTVSDEMKEALKKIRENGDKYYICSGRSYGVVPKEIEDLNPDGFVFSSGAFVVEDGKILRNIIIDKEDVKGVYELFKKEDPMIIYECGFNAYCNKYKDKQTTDFIEKFSIQPERIEEFKDFDNMDVNKISVAFKEERDYEIIKDVDSKLEVQPQPQLGAYDITLKGSTKKDGIVAVCEHLKAEGDDIKVYAFGDSLNDIEMIKYADTGVAMGNARAEVKEVADYVTDTVQNEGVLKAMKHFKLV